MKKRNKPVIPGFGLSMGITISILSLVVLIPLASLVVYTAKLSFKDFIETITRARVLASFYTSFVCAFAAAVINGIMGTILAWVLVKYDFPGKRLMDSGIVGSFFAGFGIKIAYTRIGITVAMIFVGIPFVVRSVQPVLEKMDNSYSEAAGVLGAKKTTIFWKVIFPELKPAIFAGTGLAFGRCLGEYGSVVFIAGNKPYYTEITPLVIMSELQEFDYSSATAIALVMLAVSFFILFLNSMIQQRNARILRGGNA